MMKKLFILTVFLAIALSLSACSKERDFPTNAEGVNIYQSSDTADNPSTIDIDITDSISVINIDDVSLTDSTAEIIKEWFSDAVSSEYTKSESDGGSLVTETAFLHTGGSISISSYSGIYFNTIFTYQDDFNVDVLKSKTEDFLKVYLERSLTSSEKEHLHAAIESALKNNDDIVYITEFMNTAPMYISISDTSYNLICG